MKASPEGDQKEPEGGQEQQCAPGGGGSLPGTKKAVRRQSVHGVRLHFESHGPGLAGQVGDQWLEEFRREADQKRRTVAGPVHGGGGASDPAS